MAKLMTMRSWVVLCIAGLLLEPGCASVFLSKRQSIPVTSSPVGAAVSVNGIRQGTTPVRIVLSRRTKIQVVRIESAGYDPVEIRLARRLPHNAVLADLFFGAALGGFEGFLAAAANDELNVWSQVGIWASVGAAVVLGIDAALGAGREFRPRTLEIALTRTKGTPRVETIVLSPEELRNIKWIRIVKGQ